jgi:aspartyl-tRNA(Asn)/glutamyl-tRNA(Gln) amidotransferase subunit A
VVSRGGKGFKEKRIVSEIEKKRKKETSKLRGSRKTTTAITQREQHGKYVQSSFEKFQQDLRSGKTSCVETIETELSNIETYNKDLNAFITIFDRDSQYTIATAKRLDEQVFHTKSRNLLFGIPFSIKDNIFVSGYPTTAACGAFKTFVPNTNADVVDLLLEVGGTLVGKTNMHELALGATSSSSFFGPVRNPKDRSRISGGSSGGSAVSVALSKQPLVSVGTDTGGSVRIPAALCGVCGFKPSTGLLSTEGVFPLSATLDHVGIFTKSVPDMIVAFNTIVAKKTRDEEAKLQKSLREKRLRTNEKRVRLGIPGSYFLDEIEKDVFSAFWNAVHAFEKMDEFEIVEGVQMNGYERVTRVRRTIQLKEASWFYEELLKSQQSRQLLQKDVRSLLDIGLKASMISYMSSINGRFDFTFKMWKMFQDIDILLTPTCPLVAPKLEDVIGKETGRVRSLLIRNTEPFNLSGFPALSVPANAFGANLPVGIQVVGRLGEDTQVLEVGEKLWNRLYEGKHWN